MLKKNLKTTMHSVTACMLAIVVIVSGTFAWNTLENIVNTNSKAHSTAAGARLHDDFNGTNKDIYIENYTEDDEDIVFARVRLDEYMEIGEDAGITTDGELTILRGDKKKDKEIPPRRDDVMTWDTYLYGSKDDGSEQIRKYRELIFGGDTIYMPTFNKHIYNLEADVNGTLRGPDDEILTDSDAYDDYVIYKNGETLTKVAKYATEDQNESNQHSNLSIDVDETHIAKPTLTSTVMSMEEWKINGYKPGPIWVYDIDGWAYWAQAIEPQTSTGLLLTEISESTVQEDEWYYGLSVVSQIVTANDWGTDEIKDGFYKDGITKDGESIFDQISGLIQGVSIDVNIESGKVHLQTSESIELSASVTVPDKYEGRNGYSWSIKEISGVSGLTQAKLDECFMDGVFTPVASMIGKSYLLSATADLNFNVKDSVLVHVYDVSKSSIKMNVPENVTEVSPDHSLQLTATVNGLSDKAVTWLIKDATGTTSITSSGLLTIDERQEGGTTITVRVESKVDSRIYQEKTFKIMPTFKNVSAGSDVKVSTDDLEWYVLDRKTENGVEQVMIYAAKSIGSPYKYEGNTASDQYSQWSTSDIRAYMNGDYIDDELSVIKDRIVETTLETPLGTSTSTITETTNDKVFLLTVNDLGWKNDAIMHEETTIDNPLVNETKRIINEQYWIRSPRSELEVYWIGLKGRINDCYTDDNIYIRPAMWIRID